MTIDLTRKYPKYVAPIINLANTFSHATRPKYVGQLSELILECKPERWEDWTTWYLSRRPDAIDQATDRIMEMLGLFREAMMHVDRDTVHSWVSELILQKTYFGLRIQKAILEEVAHGLERKFAPSGPADESQGIDGYLDGQPVSVKPSTYKNSPQAHSETIHAPIIYYSMKSGGAVNVDLSEVDA